MVHTNLNIFKKVIRPFSFFSRLAFSHLAYLLADSIVHLLNFSVFLLKNNTAFYIKTKQQQTYRIKSFFFYNSGVFYLFRLLVPLKQQEDIAVSIEPYNSIYSNSKPSYSQIIIACSTVAKPILRS